MNTATESSTVETPSNKTWNIALWVVQSLLAAAFLAAGATKLTTPIAELAKSMPWVEGPLGGFVRFIGASEIAGALGLVLPSATRIAPKLTVAAASALGLVMVLAAATHASRGELGVLPVNATILSMLALVAYGRAKKAPIAARG